MHRWMLKQHSPASWHAMGHDVRVLSVSVVVPSYQGGSRLPALMECLASQRTARAWEVVVVLDGSSDSSAQVLAKWQDRVPLRVIARAENRGRSATLNEGFAQARNDVLVRCDDDLLPGPDYVELFGSLIEDDPGTGVIGLYRNEYPENRYARAYGRPVDARYRAEAYAAPARRRWMFWAGNCGVHRSAWEAVGPYDETFREYGWEDVDWGYRLMRAGYGIALEPGLETIHRVAATTAAVRLERARASGRASATFRQLHGLSTPELDDSAWNTLVRAAARGRASWLERGTEVLLPVLPEAAARRVVDLGVQASFHAGQLEAASELAEDTKPAKAALVSEPAKAALASEPAEAADDPELR